MAPSGLAPRDQPACPEGREQPTAGVVRTGPGRRASRHAPSARTVRAPARTPRRVLRRARSSKPGPEPKAPKGSRGSSLPRASGFAAAAAAGRSANGGKPCPPPAQGLLLRLRRPPSGASPASEADTPWGPCSALRSRIWRRPLWRQRHRPHFRALYWAAAPGTRPDAVVGVPVVRTGVTPALRRRRRRG